MYVRILLSHRLQLNDHFKRVSLFIVEISDTTSPIVNNAHHFHVFEIFEKCENLIKWQLGWLSTITACLSVSRNLMFSRKTRSKLLINSFLSQKPQKLARNSSYSLVKNELEWTFLTSSFRSKVEKNSFLSNNFKFRGKTLFLFSTQSQLQMFSIKKGHDLSRQLGSEREKNFHLNTD